MSEPKLLLNQQPSQIITKTFQNTEYNLYLSGEISNDPDDYMEHFAVYHNAGPQDIIKLWVQSPGGSLAVGSQYIKHMRQCEAPIVAVIGMDVASQATAICLEASGWEVDDMSTFLVHGFSYSAFGHESQVYNQATFNKKLNERWVRNTYTGFLTEEEILDALKGVDLLFDADELFERLQAFDEYRTLQQQEDCDCENCVGEVEEGEEFAEESPLTEEEITKLLSEPEAKPKRSRKKS